MPGPRMPTDVLKATGRKHLSKSEEAERRAREVSVPPAQKAKPPKWLPEALRKEFRNIGRQLIAAGLYTDLDADTLGRYLIAHQQWLQSTAEAARYLQARDLENADSWSKLQERYFKQARQCAEVMGLSVTSRCRIVVPQALVNAAKVSDSDGDDEFTRMLQARQAAALQKAE